MSTSLNINGISFDGATKQWPLTDKKINIPALKEVTTSFSFGKIYLLHTEPYGSAWTLSWIVCGLLEQKTGTITKNGLPYSVSERRKDACCVRMNGGRRLLLWEQTVGSQIRQGLKRMHQSPQMEKDIVELFHLSPGRYGRPLRQFSAEGWRASCAIGYAQGKKMYCFPYVEPEVLEEEYVGWIQEMLFFLRDSGALILVPTTIRPSIQGIGDEILRVG